MELRFRDYRHLICDFDGVLTDNSVTVDSNGNECVRCSRSDGIGFSLFKKRDIDCLILSSEKSLLISHRANKMGVRGYAGIKDKSKWLEDAVMSAGLSLSETIFIGNDLNDLKAMELCGLKVCPSDAWPEIRRISDMVLVRGGGHGVVRELSTYFM